MSRIQSNRRPRSLCRSRSRLAVPRLESLEGRLLLAAELTEGNAHLWGSFASDQAATQVTLDTVRVKEGTSSIHLRTESGFDTGVQFPAANNAHWDLAGMNLFEFWAYADNRTPIGFQGNQPTIVLNTAGGSYRYEPQHTQMPNQGWQHFFIPLAGGGEWVRTSTGSPTLADVNSVEIHQDTWDFGFDIYYDAMKFTQFVAGPSPSPPAGVNPDAISPRILLYVFDPILENKGGLRTHDAYGWGDPVSLTNQAIGDLRASSHGLVNYQVVQTVIADLHPYYEDGSQFNDASFVANWESSSRVNPSAMFDYKRFIAENNIVARVESGDIDEVWIYTSPMGGTFESTMAGDGAYWINGITPGVASSRVFPIMGLNYERGVAEALHSFGHRAEGTMDHSYGTQAPNLDNNWNRFTYQDRYSPGQGLGGVGNIHYPVNSHYELQALSWGDGSGVPASGRGLVVVGIDNSGRLHIRIFDHGGGRTTDTDETKLPAAQAGAIAALKGRLPGFYSPRVLTLAEMEQVITELEPILGISIKPDYDYDNPLVVVSNADDWMNYPNFTGATRAINSGEWSPTHVDPQRDYLNWWYSHLPHFAGLGTDGFLNNWWRYLTDLNQFKAGARGNLQGSLGVAGVQLVGLTSGSAVGGIVPLKAEAVADGALGRVDFYIDGQYLGTDTLAPYTIPWDTRTWASGTHTIIAKVYELQHQSEYVSAPILVTIGAVASPPVLSGLADRMVNEGSALTFTATASSAGTLTYSLDPGAPAGAQIDPATGVFTWTPPDGPGTFPVTIRATDGGSPALSDIKTFAITVANVAPAVSTGADAATQAGAPFQRAGSFADPGADAWTATVDYGDGGGTRPLALNIDRSFQLEHTYSRAGDYSVTVSVSDGDGGVDTRRFVVRVASPSDTPTPPGSAGTPTPPGPTDTIAPRVVYFRTTRRGGNLRMIFVGFSEPLSAAMTTALSNYRLISAGRDRRFGTRDDKVLTLRSASYDAARREIALTPRTRVALNQPLQLIIASPGGPTDPASNALDGDGDGLPGGNFTGRFGARPRK